MAENKTDSDMKELGEVLDTITEKIPKLIGGVMGTLYSADSGKNMGKAIGSFYKELLESGIPEDAALEMAKDYMLSIKDISKMVDN